MTAMGVLLLSLVSPGTIRIEIGSRALDGGVYQPHAALVRVRLGDSTRVVATWTNELTRAVGGKFTPGTVIVAPVWSPGMTAWKVEEYRRSDRVLLATWWLLERSPYMVYGEVPLPNGQVRKMTEVELPAGARP